MRIPLRFPTASALLLLVACGDISGIDNPYAGRDVTSPVEVAGGRRYQDVSAGFFHTCALDTGGLAYCWGSNEFLQLGVADAPQQCEMRNCARTPVPVAGGRTYAQISAGITHTCALTPEGQAFCWGGGYGTGGAGSLGGGVLQRSATPVAVVADSAFVSISVGGSACALTASGMAFCWGSNAWGEVGDGSTAGRLAPVAVAGGLRFRSVEAGSKHACGRTTTGEAYCWGSNQWGQLGTGHVPPNSYELRSLTPVRVVADTRFATIGAGGEHTCAQAEDGRAYCWGRNDNAGQLGDRTAVSHRGLPAPVADGRVFASLQAGEITTCGVTPGGESFCWGSNYFGALGNGTTSVGGVNHPVPTRGGPYRRVSPGGSHTCGLAADGRVFCWGDGFYGQVGGG